MVVVSRSAYRSIRAKRLGCKKLRQRDVAHPCSYGEVGEADPGPFVTSSREVQSLWSGVSSFSKLRCVSFAKASAPADDVRKIVRTSRSTDAPIPALMERALAAATLAPSINNTQPWIFQAGTQSAQIVLRADYSRRLHEADPETRQLIISCGAALTNLLAELHASGIRTTTAFRRPSGRSPDFALVSLAKAGAGSDRDDLDLADAIPRRFTARSAFGPDPVPVTLLDVMIESASAGGLELSPITLERDAFAALHRRAHRIQERNHALARETAAWTRHDASARDGIVPATFGRDSTVNRDLHLPQRDFAINREIPTAQSRERSGWETLVVLASAGDGPEDWIRVGRELERLLLIAAGRGVMASYLNQCVEVSPLRESLRRTLGLAGVPQLIMRLGFPAGEPGPLSPRRPLREVVRIQEQLPRSIVDVFSISRTKARGEEWVVHVDS